MAGDPKQLPPTLMSDGALDAQMDRTLFDRLQDTGEPLSDCPRSIQGNQTMVELGMRMHQVPEALFVIGHEAERNRCVLVAVRCRDGLCGSLPSHHASSEFEGCSWSHQAQGRKCEDVEEGVMWRAGMVPILLDTQYRMHPLIAAYPSTQFYNGLLRTGITAADRPLAKGTRLFTVARV